MTLTVTWAVPCAQCGADVLLAKAPDPRVSAYCNERCLRERRSSGGCRGWTSVRLLQQLYGKPWNAVTKAYVEALRPSSVRVSTGLLKSNAESWRVTVMLRDDERIEYIEQEVEVPLPDGVAHGMALDEALRGLS